MEEEWKQIIDYPNYYISNIGKVKNIHFDRMVVGGYSNGYNVVNLYNNGKRKMFRVARLVGEYFLDGFESNLDIDHIDRNRNNDNITNLRWVSRGDNLRNRNKFNNCSSKYKGVSFFKRDCKWKVSVFSNGKSIHLGVFETEEEASKKYLDWNTENNFIV